MQNIANHAIRMPKLSKAGAQDYLRTLYATAATDNQRNALASLYNYFMPAAPKSPKTPFQWVAMATSNDATRPYLHHCYSTGTDLMATDGHRLHLVPATLPAGYYHRITGEPIDLPNCTFPDCKRLMPQNPTLAHLDVGALPIQTVGKAMAYDVGMPYHLINKQYLDAVVVGMDAGKLSFAHCGFSNSTLFLTDGIHTALISGVRK